MDCQAIITLEHIKHADWVRDIIARRAWSLLRGCRQSMITTENSLRKSNTKLEAYQKRTESAEAKALEKEKELENIELFLWREGPKIFEKVV